MMQQGSAGALHLNGFEPAARTKKYPDPVWGQDIFGAGVHNGLALVLRVTIQLPHCSPTDKTDLLA